MIKEDISTNLGKTLNDLALAAGRYYQSDQTGFVHYYQGEVGQAGHQTIPLFENALFILALLRSRIVENIQEAKNLLKRLLTFQNRQETLTYGNFPVYLHDFPICYDAAYAIHLLLPFYTILKAFGHILGQDLKFQLEHAIQDALSFSLHVHEEKPFPYFLSVSLASLQLAFGVLLKDKRLEQDGLQSLTFLSDRQLEGCQTTAQLAHVLSGLQLVYPSLINSPWSKLWHFMEKTWHFSTGTFCGPCLREWQDKGEPKLNLYDLYAGYFAKQFSRRASLLQIYHLQAVLIQSSQDAFEPVMQPYCITGLHKQQSWQLHNHLDYVYTLLEKKEALDPSVEKTFTPFRFIWGDLQLTHSLVCQGGRYTKVDFSCVGNDVVLIFDLPEEGPGEDREKRREIEFFIDFHPNVRFTINSFSSMTFELGNSLLISFGHFQCTVNCQLIEGKGDFLGHIMRSNRPSQIDHKGENRFNAHDWTFFLRTIRRQGPCRLQIEFNFQSTVNQEI